MASAAMMHGLHVQKSYVLSWINGLQSRNNVKPTVDINQHSPPSPRNTCSQGSSLDNEIQISPHHAPSITRSQSSVANRFSVGGKVPSPHHDFSMTGSQGYDANRSSVGAKVSYPYHASSMTSSQSYDNNRSSMAGMAKSSNHAPSTNSSQGSLSNRSWDDEVLRSPPHAPSMKSSHGSLSTRSSMNEVAMSPPHAPSMNSSHGSLSTRSSMNEVLRSPPHAPSMNSSHGSLSTRSSMNEVLRSPPHAPSMKSSHGSLSTRSSMNEVAMSPTHAPSMNSSHGSLSTRSSMNEVAMSPPHAPSMNSSHGSLSTRSSVNEVAMSPTHAPSMNSSHGSLTTRSSNNDGISSPSHHPPSKTYSIKGAIANKSSMANEVSMSPYRVSSMNSSQSAVSKREDPLSPHPASSRTSSPGLLADKTSPPSSYHSPSMNSVQRSLSDRLHTKMEEDPMSSNHAARMNNSNGSLSNSSCSDEFPMSPKHVPSMASSRSSVENMISPGSKSSIQSGSGTNKHSIPGQMDVQNHFAGIGSYLHQSYENKKICDICFKVGEKVIPVHKLVLASQSQLFKQVLEDQVFSMEPRTPKLINIKNVCPEALEVFIHYLYTGQLETKTHLVADLLKLGETLHVDGVKKILYSQVLNMKYYEILELLASLRGTKHVKMCNILMEKICKKFRKFKEIPAFYTLDIETVCFILSNDNLIIQCESDIFDVAVKWLNSQNPRERACYLDRIMGCVRFPHMTQKQLFSCYKKCPMLKESPVCMEQITLANWIQTSLSLNEGDPLDLEVPIPRNHKSGGNGSNSVTSFLSKNSSMEQINENEEPDVEIEISHMSVEMTRDLNNHAHAYLYDANPPVVSNGTYQHRNAKRYYSK